MDEYCPRCGTALLEWNSTCVGCETAEEIALDEGIPVEEVLAKLRQGRERQKQQEDAMSPEERAAAAADQEAWVQRRMSGELPSHIPPPPTVMDLPCRWLSEDEPLDGIRLSFERQGVRCWHAASGMQLFFRTWADVQAVAVEGPEMAERRTTIPRFAAAGILSLLAKKNVTCSYVVLQTTGVEYFFEVVGSTVFQLRAKLSGVTSWHARYGDELRASLGG